MNQSAQGLASLGRGNDSMLVHMTPREVQGLQGLAMAHGGSLTINPKTGLPEAGFLDSILPTVAGFGLNALFPGLGALGTGLLVGGVTALTSGDLGKGVMAGFGAGSGAGLGSTFSKMGQSAIGGITPEAAKMAVGENIVGQLPANVAQNAASNLGMFNAPGATATMGAAGATAVPNITTSLTNQISPFTNNTLGADLGIRNTTPTVGVNTGGYDAVAELAKPQPSLLGDAGNRLGDMYKGASEFAKDPFGAGYDAFKAQGGNTFDLLSPVASVGMEALKPEPYAGYQDPDKDKYRGPQGQLNLSDRFDTGLRLVAKGGYIDGYAMGGTVQSGGIRDLYGTPDNPPAMSSGLGGFGLGRLNDLASEQARSQAQTLGYDEGGAVAGGDAVDESAPNPEGVVSKYTTVVDDKGVSSRVRVPYQYEKIITKGAEDFYDIPPIEYAANLYPGSILPKFKKEGFADGGDVGMNIEKQQALNLDRLPSLNVEAGLGIPSGSQYDYFRERPKLYRGLYDMSQSDNPLVSIMGNAIMKNPSNFKFSPQMAKGGYLDGQGDGMSDSIPATIEGKQPARLADGEFVIPADVVSHLGNGSSKAGSKRLYAMLDKVRQARTGNKKQGKEIKAEKYLPA